MKTNFKRGFTLIEALVVVAIVGIVLSVLLSFARSANACGWFEDCSSDGKAKEQQEKLLQEAQAQVGMPAIKNFREKKLLKDILEMRDQDGLVTYTYIFSEYNNKFVFVCNSIGYGIPAATQYTNPQKVSDSMSQGGYAILPQADPNGLFSPDSANGTWIMCKEPKTGKARPQYIEDNIATFTYKID